MTTLVKLGIQGIRSFDHEHMELIDFERPVTLIVGPNGSGKTTIIECLKMASCGQLPPNSRAGHGFLHDPAIVHLPEVKAQIRMLFRNGAEQEKEICAIRSFQVTNKRDRSGKFKQQFKALEGVLRTIADDGSKASISHRCANMDAQVPECMGVSKAILDSVIFCHQEDSSWPLQSPADVKKRFDDIFGATRYTQALKHIKDLQKEWNKTTRDRRADADLSQAHLDQANKIRTQKTDREKTADELTKELHNLDEQIAGANEGVQRAELEVVEYESRGVRVQELRSLNQRLDQEREGVLRQMEQRGQEFYQESFEQLEQQSKQLQEKVMVESEHKVRQAKANLAAGEEAYHAAFDNAKSLREEIGQAVIAAEELTKRRSDLAERLKRAEEPSVAALRARLDKHSAEFQRAEQENRARDAQQEESLRVAENAYREASLDAERNESRAEDAAKTLRRLEEEAKALARAPADLEALVRAMRENEAALGTDNDKRLRDLEANQQEISRQRHDLTYKISRKSSEVAQLEAQSDAHVEVDACRRRAREAEEELEKRVKEARPRLTELLGTMPEPGDAEVKVSAELQQVQEQVRQQGQAMQELHHRQSSASARKSVAENALRQHQQEEARLAAELGVASMPQGGSGGAQGAASDFQARLTTQREQVELARKDMSMTESAQHMYEKFREKSRLKNACQFCRRGFCSDQERSVFEDCVEKRIVTIPAMLLDARQRLEKSQEDLNKLEAQRTRWERLEQVRSVEMARQQREVAGATEEERNARAAVEPKERGQRTLEERLRQLYDLRGTASALQHGARVAEEQRQAVRAKEARIVGASHKVSLQAEREELRRWQERLTELGREEDAVRTQRDLLAKQQESIRTQLAEQKSRLQSQQEKVARRTDVDSDLAARQADLREYSENAKRARVSAEAGDGRARQMREERQSLQQRYRQELEQRDAQMRTLQREVDSLTELEKSVEAMKGRVDNADAVRAKLAVADDGVRAAERERDGLRQRLEGEEERRRKRETFREVLDANLRLKRCEMEVKKQEAEVQQLLADLGGRDLEALRRGLEASRHRSVELQKEKSFREGELQQTRAAAQALEADLSSPLYHGVEQRHREAIIQHESAAYASKDLGRYHIALDKALMKFHTLKMNEINKNIRELWQRIYRGRDIDYIVIRSDTDEPEEGAPVPKAGGDLRAGTSYNYRVAMVCGDAELEMRGRCSAGQRVLASLIIRLALADTFCVACGILALDEPTTNLDAANIRGLAEAIAQLIESRRKNARFQLVLITHDEVFVDHLCQLQVSDWYYHIRKDESGCSKIEKRDINQLKD